VSLGTLITSFFLFAWYYLAVRQGLVDDVFIYLHTARNGADHSTWQYFTLIDRPALLASSPLKIILLTMAAKITAIVGYGERTFFNAKLILVAYAPLAWVIWYPFWTEKKNSFMLVGILYFLLSLTMDSVVDFEGGLLFFWAATVAMLFDDPVKSARQLTWLLPLGLYIRPDFALPILVVSLYLLERKSLIPFTSRMCKRAMVFTLIWVAICHFFAVYPIPVTYWTKASIPQMFEERYMIEVLFERIGFVTAFRLVSSSHAMATLVGIFFVLGFLLSIVRDNRTRRAACTATLVTGLLVAVMPANYWWYYQNFVLLVLGVCVGMLSRETWLPKPIVRTGFQPVAVFLAAAFCVLTLGKSFNTDPNLWRFDVPSRAQGYQYLASCAVGSGEYDLPGIGRVYIKNPEIGMTSYFSGDGAWIWDSAGLAQPLKVPNVMDSPLRHLYPRRLKETAHKDILELSARNGSHSHVVEVWAMEDRRFDQARLKCRYVIEQGAICANDYIHKREPQGAR
jgi:hypothetical protein